MSKLVPNHELVINGELDKVAKSARKQGIRNLFLLGDLGHGPRLSYDSQIAMLSWLRENPDMQVYAILGNHDLFSEDPEVGHSMQLLEKVGLPNFHLFTKPTIKKVDGVKVNFLPWPHSSFNRKMLNVAHIECKGTKMDNGRPYVSDNMPSNKPLSVIGHLHTKQQSGNAYYPGPLYQTNFGEQEKRFYLHVQYNSVDDYEMRFVPHKPTIKLVTVNIESKADLKTIPKDPNTLVRVVVADGLDLDPARFSKYPNVVRIRPYKSKDDLETILQEDLEDGKDIKIRTRDFLLSYLKARSPDPVLNKQAMKLWSAIVREPVKG